MDCPRYQHPATGRIQPWIIEGQEKPIAGLHDAVVANNMEALVYAALHGMGLLYGCAGETGKEQVVQVHCNEGVAIRIGPEPCGCVREDVTEASAGVRAGQPLSHEIVFVPGADTFHTVEGNISQRVIASVARTRRGRRTWHARTLLDREPGDLQSDRRRLYGSTARIGKVRSRSR